MFFARTQRSASKGGCQRDQNLRKCWRSFDPSRRPLNCEIWKRTSKFKTKTFHLSPLFPGSNLSPVKEKKEKPKVGCWDIRIPVSLKILVPDHCKDLFYLDLVWSVTRRPEEPSTWTRVRQSQPSLYLTVLGPPSSVRTTSLYRINCLRLSRAINDRNLRGGWVVRREPGGEGRELRVITNGQKPPLWVTRFEAPPPVPSLSFSFSFPVPVFRLRPIQHQPY